MIAKKKNIKIYIYICKDIRTTTNARKEEKWNIYIQIYFYIYLNIKECRVYTELTTMNNVKVSCGWMDGWITCNLLLTNKTKKLSPTPILFKHHLQRQKETMEKNYIALTEGTFKQPFLQQKQSFPDRKLANST